MFKLHVHCIAITLFFFCSNDILKFINLTITTSKVEKKYELFVSTQIYCLIFIGCSVAVKRIRDVDDTSFYRTFRMYLNLPKRIRNYGHFLIRILKVT